MPAVKTRKLPPYKQRKRTTYGSKFVGRPIRQGKNRDRRYDEIFPRGEGKFRYRIYRLRAGELDLLAACPDAEAMGVGLVKLNEEDEFIGDDSVGVLDTAHDPGHWIVHPFTLGRKPR